MARVTVEDCLEHVNDQFALVHLSSLRYRQLHKGVDSLVPSGKNKLVVTSLREIAAGKVRFREDVKETLLKGRQRLVSQRLQTLAGQELHIEGAPADEPLDSPDTALI